MATLSAAIATQRTGIELAVSGPRRTTNGGGTAGYGTVFKITPSGTENVLDFFTGTDGQGPWSSLLQGSDGNLYGTTYYGGASGNGTVFKVTLK